MTGTSPFPPPPTRGSEGTRGLPAAGGPWPHCGSRSAGSCGPPPGLPPPPVPFMLSPAFAISLAERGEKTGARVGGRCQAPCQSHRRRCRRRRAAKKASGGRRRASGLPGGEGGRLAALPPASLPLPGAAAAERPRRARPRGGERRRPEGWVRVHAAGYRGGVRGGARL